MDIAGAWLDGVLVDITSARVSAFGRGALFGDGVFEVVCVRNGVPFRLANHLDRLETSADLLAMNARPHRGEFQREAELACASVARHDRAHLKLVLTRAGTLGVDPPLDEIMTRDSPGATRLVFARAYAVAPESERAVREGVRVMTSRFRASAVPGAKSLSYAGSIVARIAARRASADEALALDDNDNVIEGATSNVCAIMRGARGPVLVAPVAGALRGVTRACVLSLARDRNMAIEERPLSVVELRAAREAFITSTMRGVWGVGYVDNARIGGAAPTPAPGPTTSALAVAYEQLVARECRGF